jgi:hypothetical protein
MDFGERFFILLFGFGRRYSAGKGATLGLGFGGGLLSPPKLMPVII